MNDLVSIIIPSYKRHRELVERAVESVLKQTYTSIEIVLVDDNAGEELKAYRKELQEMINFLQDDRILYIQNEVNLGGAGARNEGIRQANGTYITFLDDDDVYLPLKIEEQLSFMLQNDLDCSFTKLCLYNEKDELIDVREHNLESYDRLYLKKYHLIKQITGTPTFMIKRNVLEEVGGFDIVPMGQEFYLMQKIIWGNYKIGYFPKCYVKAYRTKAEAISTGRAKIIGEKSLYRHKKKFFKELSFKDRRYIRCRHYAVMAVAYKRNKKYFCALCMLLIATFCAPITAVKEAVDLRKRKKEVRNEHL